MIVVTNSSSTPRNFYCLFKGVKLQRFTIEVLQNLHESCEKSVWVHHHMRLKAHYALHPPKLTIYGDPWHTDRCEP